jgi:hypothetical protein
MAHITITATITAITTVTIERGQRAGASVGA